ncbi:MAG: transporter, partial [Bacteroidota bacterium]
FSDSIAISGALINSVNGSRVEQVFKIAPPSSGDTTIFNLQFSSFGRDGDNSLVVDVAPAENEFYRENNRVTLSNAIQVTPDQTNPVLDVTFDGFHILNGDIVSPTPMIAITLRDDNSLVAKSDTSGFNLEIRGPAEDADFQRVNFTDPKVSFTSGEAGEAFEVNYEAGPLENGVHTLRVNAEDAFGNAAGTEPLEIAFEVINESTITHFYPYPNPFSTSCRFVFTLTGSEIPNEIKIQIMTVSGRVVREITQDEIGPLRIGNNITEFAWDGRDEYGDLLANGVYFYRVFTNIAGNQVDQRATSADRAFKRGFGKLYILR